MDDGAAETRRDGRFVPEVRVELEMIVRIWSLVELTLNRRLLAFSWWLDVDVSSG